MIYNGNYFAAEVAVLINIIIVITYNVNGYKINAKERAWQALF